MSGNTRIGSKSRVGSIVVHPPIDSASWVAVDDGALPQAECDFYLRRRQGILLYLDGASAVDLKAARGLGRSQIYRLITERCLKQHPDGNLNGWRGALPYHRVKTYSRSAPLKVGNWGGGAVGALQWVFESPEGQGLEAEFKKHILDKTALLEAPRRPRLALFRWFIDELRTRGFERRGEWPFNVDKRGYVSISK